MISEGVFFFAENRTKTKKTNIGKGFFEDFIFDVCSYFYSAVIAGVCIVSDGIVGDF